MVHNTPRLETRIEEQKEANVLFAKALNEAKATIETYTKQLNSGILRVNELELLKNIRDGKYQIFDTTTMKFIETKWV